MLLGHRTFCDRTKLRKTSAGEPPVYGKPHPLDKWVGGQSGRRFDLKISDQLIHKTLRLCLCFKTLKYCPIENQSSSNSKMNIVVRIPLSLMIHLIVLLLKMIIANYFILQVFIMQQQFNTQLISYIDFTLSIPSFSQ